VRRQVWKTTKDKLEKGLCHVWYIVSSDRNQVHVILAASWLLVHNNRFVESTILCPLTPFSCRLFPKNREQCRLFSDLYVFGISVEWSGAFVQPTRPT
jgi:hypothetical protein